MRLTHWAVTVCLGTIASATSGITSLSIGGASFPADPYVAAAYNFSYSFGVSATYSTSNSGTGQQNTFNGIFQVGASDVPINTALYGSNGSIVAIPAIAGGLVVTYNIPGLSTSTQLKFSRKVLPRIFDGTIASWNDPRLVADNPALANQSSPIIIITRSAGSGSTLNFIKSLKLMDASNGFEGSPYTNPKFKLGVSTSVLAATTDAAASIVGSFPHTITYLSQAEALLAEANSNGFCNFAMAQHLNGDYIPCNSASIQTAVVNVDSATLDKLDFSTGGLSILDVSTPGAYPIAIISNFVVRPLQLANNRPTTLATLEFICLPHHTRLCHSTIRLLATRPSNI
ncbi:hypothetical protein BC830DRAFT_314256 [Chytriomyces sp. MP71]|nr:hypothetical protein BC830DRAFT_314256 [Chytriomyces sp. MP71]